MVTGATLRLRDAGAKVPSKLLLMYPCVHPQLPEPEVELAGKIATLSPLIRFEPATVYGPLARNYLGGTEDTATPYAMPALADVTGLPPTLVHNCEYDALRASGEAFALQLRAAGVPVEESLAEGVLHGHLSHPWLPQSQAALDRMVAFLAKG
jgi:acetyl esterase/lipase